MIHLVSGWSAEYTQLAALTWDRNKAPYARRHGYGIIPFFHEAGVNIAWDRPVQWAKIMRTLDDGEWMFCTGSDLLIVHPDRPIAEYTDDNYDLVIYCDGNKEPFSDCFLIRSSPVALTFLESLKSGDNEQQAIAVSLSRMPYAEYMELLVSQPGTAGFYEEAGRALNRSRMKVKLLSCLTERKMTGDIWFEGECIPPYHRCYPDTFCMHMGARSLEERIRLVESRLPIIPAA